MSKTVIFNNQAYELDENKLAPINQSMVSFLTTELAGTGATIKFNNTTYEVDSAKLSTGKTELVTFLGTIEGEGKVIEIDGVEYSVASSALEGANAAVAETLVNLCITPSEGLEYELNEDGASYSVISIGTCTDTDVVIPAEHEGLPVTALKKHIGTAEGTDGPYEAELGTFHSCDSLTSVTIPDSVTSICEEAFVECTGLISVVIPDSVETIGARTFSGCTSLTSITIPDSVTSIGNYAFGDCNGLLSITIPDSVTSIGSSAFYNTAYYNNSSNWENGVLYIGKYLIKAKTDISGAYTVKEETKAIADAAFSNCTGLTSVTIGNSITKIGEYVFRDCLNLTSVTIGDGVESIGYGAFLECDSLTSVSIGKGVTSISNGVFERCYKLVEVINKSATLTITAGSRDNGYVAYYALEVHGGDSKIKTQGDYQFYTVEGVNYLVNYIGNDTEITLPENYNEENYVINDHAFDDNNKITKVTISNGVTSIGYRAFYECTYLASVMIGDSVTSIGDQAFSRCTKLTSITIPDSVTSIGSSAFYECYILFRVTIGSGVTSIGAGAFRYCYELSYIYINQDVNAISGSPWGASSSIYWNSTGPDAA